MSAMPTNQTTDMPISPPPLATLSTTTAPPALFGFLEEVRRLTDAELGKRLMPPADDPGRLVKRLLGVLPFQDHALHGPVNGLVDLEDLR